MTDILDDLLGDGGPRDEERDGCHVCGAGPKGACSACGQVMCSAHAWTMLGVCTTCARSDRMVRFHREAEAQERNWLES